MFKLHLRSFAIAHRRALARLSLVVKQLPRWFESTTLVVQQKNPTTMVGFFSWSCIIASFRAENTQEYKHLACKIADFKQLLAQRKFNLKISLLEQL